MSKKKDTAAVAEATADVPQETLEEAQLAELQDRLGAFQSMLETTGNVFGHDKAGLIGLQAAMSMLSTKTGMYARIPIYCKGGDCPYQESCPLTKYGIAPRGQACPVEIAKIQQKYADYAEEFDLDDPNTGKTDHNLVNEIIKMEIYMERCDGLMSAEGSPVQMMVTGVSEDGTPIESPDISKAVLAYEKFSKKRMECYNLLMATRKDKKHETGEQSKSFVDIMKEATKMKDFFTIDQRPDYIEGYDPEPVEDAQISEGVEKNA